jgi:hypothetical protein
MLNYIDVTVVSRGKYGLVWLWRAERTRPYLLVELPAGC